MTSEQPQHYDFSNAQFTGAQNFAPGGVAKVDTAISTTQQQPDKMDELRQQVAALVATLNNDHSTGPELEEARWRAEEVAEELNDKSPQPERIKARWSRLENLVPAFTAASSIATITNLVNELF